MIEPEDMVLAQYDSWSSFQNNSFLHFSSIYITECSLFGGHCYHPFMIFDDTVLTKDMWATSLDVLRNIGFRRAYTSEAIFNVIKQALGHGGIFIQIHKMWCL